MDTLLSKQHKDGYFIGNFEDSLYRSGNIEVANRFILKGAIDEGYYRKKDTEIINIITGKLEINGREYKAGDSYRWDPGERIGFYALKNSIFTMVKYPGTPNDNQKVRYDSYKELDENYSYYINKDVLMSNIDYENYGGSKIDSADISVVVQGYADSYYTRNLICSIRKYFPDSQIILSTWKECDTSIFDCDEIILNEDPGNCNSGRWENHSIDNNGNRQIVSSKAGVEMATRKYTLRLRSDLLLLGDDISAFFEAFNKKQGEFQFFSKRMIIGELYTRKKFNYYYGPDSYSVDKPLHPSDWFVFGLTEDIKKFYSYIEPMQLADMKDYVCKNEKKVVKNKYLYTWRYTTEQYMFYSVVKHFRPEIKFEDWTDTNKDLMLKSKSILFDNFIILNFLQHKILNQKYTAYCFANTGIKYCEKGLYKFNDFLNYYSEL